jgi:hypothetical protein
LRLIEVAMVLACAGAQHASRGAGRIVNHGGVVGGRCIRDPRTKTSIANSWIFGKLEVQLVICS